MVSGVKGQGGTGAAADSTHNAMSGVEALRQWHWEPQPKAQAVINELVEEFTSKNAWAKRLGERMMTETGTRLIDWIDHIQIPASRGLKKRLLEVGWKPAANVRFKIASAAVPANAEWYINELGMFPDLFLVDGETLRLGIKVEFVADFLAAHDLWEAPIVGEALGQMRIATVNKSKGYELLAVERHGWRGLTPPTFDAEKAARHQQHLEAFRRRRRHGDETACFAETNRLVDAAIAGIGRDWACDAFFAAERDYWMRRNRAAQVQYGRQQRLGLGWANHDHHTYRSSREHYTKLIALWEKFGMYCRERFYAGAEAQWGAQVVEHPVTGIITFNDVDMSPEELMGDFPHEGLKASREHLGTVGLWVGLHGEAVLSAGMHHLEAMFDWHALVEQLEKDGGVKTMAPFTTFPYLRQAFTEGEVWTVCEDRLKLLQSRKYITPQQAEVFRREGALGSHLENLERNDGFKGFNQQGVSDIINRTDPRKQSRSKAAVGGH
jgi:hypothetical protein